MKKNFKKLLSLLLIFSMLLSITPVQEVSAKTAKKPKLSSSKVELKVGSSKTIKLKNYTKLSKAKIKKVKWTSSKKGVLSIKTSGKYKQNCKITAKKSGSTTLKLKYNNKTYKCTVKVNKKKTSEQPTTTEQKTTEKVTTESKTTETPTKPEHQHEYTEWYITKAVSCNDYGTEERVCRTCGDKQSRSISPKGHDWSEYDIVRDATCTEEGLKTRKCNYCGTEEELAIKPNGHELGEYIIDNSTCIHEGSKSRQCKNCSYIESEKLPLEEHKYSAWNVVKNPTCSETGRETRLCNVCYHSEDREIPATEGHVSTAGGTKECHSKCSVCGKVLDDETYHRYTDEIIRQATCAITGVVKHTCSCGYSYTEEVPKTDNHPHFINNKCVQCGELNKEYATEVHDISENSDGSVILYAFKLDVAEDTVGTYYDVYIDSKSSNSTLKSCNNGFGRTMNGCINFFGTGIGSQYIHSIEFLNPVTAGESTCGMFEKLGNIYYENTGKLARIDNLDNLKTDYTKNMSSMFKGATIGEYLTIPFTTHHATDMSHMFEDMTCVKTISFNTKFDTSLVTNMSSMFRDMSKCQSINIQSCGGFDTSRVKTMAYMFAGVGNDISENVDFTLDLSSFDTTNVADMQHMFDNMCYSCELDNFKIKLGDKFSTKSATFVVGMFYKTGAKTMHNRYREGSKTSYIDLGSFGVEHSRITDFKSIFTANTSSNTTYFFVAKSKNQAVIDWFNSEEVLSSSYFY